MKFSKSLPFLTSMLLVLAFSLVQADTPPVRQSLTGPAQVSVLGALLGDHPAYGAAAHQERVMKGSPTSIEAEWALILSKRKLGKAAPGERLAMNRLPESPVADSVSWSRIHFYDGLLDLLDSNYPGAVDHFAQSRQLGGDPGTYRLVALYLQKYGQASPVFSHFNGGFYNYVSDSLRWNRGGKGEPAGYREALETVLDLSMLSEQAPVFLELAGDVLSRHPDQFTANWFGAMAYYRAAYADSSAKEEYRRKAWYALEAPRTNENRFDLYQLTQLGKHLEADLDSIALWRGQYQERESDALKQGSSADQLLVDLYGPAAEEVVWMRENERGEVAAVIVRAEAKEAAEAGRDRKFVGEVDLKTIKSERTFNIYAGVVILVVIAAAIFLGMQIRKNSREA